MGGRVSTRTGQPGIELLGRPTLCSSAILRPVSIETESLKYNDMGLIRGPVLKSNVFTGAVCRDFILMDDIARLHNANLVEECLEREDICRVDWSARSSERNYIWHSWNALGNRDYTGMWVRLGSTDLMAGKVVFLRGLLSPIRVVDLTELWFQQDGATCHTARATIDLLKDTFGDRLISRFGPVNWPPRSCDLTPLDYFLWGYVKSLVYADKPQTLDHLEDNIRRVIADIRPQMLEKVIENWTSRLDNIRASRGSHMPEIIFKM
ncbi:putative transposable element [Trichonephila clavipes]|nr:putative transposable element [Trichonephila clavipes]